ncbi:hypothetical protein MVES_003645 [Malassezia vespertilionis]|uniref:Tethering factor for nuclear proteasome STS1 n=1 Tax=Malassezia vespertilionis TaxID=2020962 RepID=A0A2N1J7D4_9BASI|nr:hypothetical protein MVES_003645 [Malassezia vespertilionis]
MDASVVTPPPPIPFNAGRSAHPIPPPLSFGFGCGSSFGGNDALQGLASPLQAVSMPWRATPPLMPSDAWTKSGALKRRLSGSDVEEPEDEEMAASPLLSKRRRAGLRAFTDASTESQGRNSSCARRRTSGTDLGKLLASLDKPALLSILHGLVSKSDDVADTIYTLLPTPSLDSVAHALDQTEAKIRAALPTAHGQHAQVRDQFAWMRLRGCLAELASEVRSFLPFFSMQEHTHPATCFSFLHLTTMRMLRIAQLLPDIESVHAPKPADTLERIFAALLPPSALAPDSPDTLTNTIFPALLKAWEAWLRCVSNAVNEHGRMYGHEVVTQWARDLASLSLAGAPQGESMCTTEHALRRTMDHARAQMHAALGWMIGPTHRHAWFGAPSLPLDVGSA